MITYVQICSILLARSQIIILCSDMLTTVVTFVNITKLEGKLLIIACQL